MTDKKNIVIKVKYPTSRGQRPDEDLLTPQMITEWNIKRIALVLGALVLIIALPLYFNFSSSQQEVLSPLVASPEKETGQEKGSANSAESEHRGDFNTASVEKKIDTVHKPAVPVKIELENTGKKRQESKNKEAIDQPPLIMEKQDKDKVHNRGRLVKAALSYKIINKKPVDIIKSSVRVSKAKAIWVNYFTEIRGMDKQVIYHEWITNGKVATRRRLTLSADRWRTASRRLFDHTAEGRWRVRAVDEKGRVLDQKEFNIILVR